MSWKEKPYPVDKTDPDDADLIWPGHPLWKKVDESGYDYHDETDEVDLPVDVDVFELMENNLESPERESRVGGYRAHTWRKEWVEDGTKGPR